MPRLLNSVCWLHKSRSVPIPGSAENGLRAELEPGFIRKAWGRQKKHTHTHEMSYEMLPQQVQERLRQKSCNRLMNFCTGSIRWSKKSCQSQCSCKHPSTDDDGNSSVLTFGKVGENCKKTWRKYRENIWNILVLPSFFCSGLKYIKGFAGM